MREIRPPSTISSSALMNLAENDPESKKLAASHSICDVRSRG
jgi:hypothetical protein